MPDPFVGKPVKESIGLSRLLAVKTKTMPKAEKARLAQQLQDLLDVDSHDEMSVASGVDVSGVLREKSSRINGVSKSVPAKDDTEKTLVDSDNRPPTNPLPSEMTSGTSEESQNDETSASSK